MVYKLLLRLQMGKYFVIFILFGDSFLVCSICAFFKIKKNAANQMC